MKKLLLILALLSQFGYSQNKVSVVLKTNTLIYIAKTGFNVSAEFTTSKEKSINVTFETGNGKYTYVNPERNKFTVLILERRNYHKLSKSDTGLSGFYNNPYLKYRYKDKYQEYVGGWFANGGKFKSHSLGVGYTVGYQNFLFKRISIEPKFGLGLMFKVLSKGETKPTTVQPDGILGLSVGLKI